MRRLAACAAIVALFLPPVPSAAAQVQVVTTTSVLASLVHDVGGDRVAVTALVPVGASPETYQPTPGDVATLRTAALVVENGAGLEAWLAHTLQDAARPDVAVVVCSDGLPVRDGNPHLWLDPGFARDYEHRVREALIRVDPAGKSEYLRNSARADRELAVLAEWIRGRISEIPPAQRTMIVFHDAWKYYAARFGLRDLGSIESSPGAEPTARWIAQLSTLARENHVRAIFGEPEFSPKLARTLAQSAGISVVTDLYDDSLGTDSQVTDYRAMLRYDTDVIVRALR